MARIVRKNVPDPQRQVPRHSNRRAPKDVCSKHGSAPSRQIGHQRSYTRISFASLRPAAKSEILVRVVSRIVAMASRVKKA